MDKSWGMTVFARVVDEEGFSAAARALNMSQSAVSKLVTRLENRLGARLLNRTTRRLSLTEEGQAFYVRSKRIIADIDEAELAVHALHAAPRGTLRVTAAVAFADHQVLPHLPEFFALYPEVQVELQGNDNVVNLVQDGYDVGIRTGSLVDSTLVSRKLAQDKRVICATPAYLAKFGVPKTLDELGQHNCLRWIGDPAHLNDWPVTGPDGTPRIIHATGNFETNTGELYYRAAISGIGVARVAGFVAGADLAAGRLVRVLPQYDASEPHPVHAVFPSRHLLSPKVRAFIDFIAQKFAAQPWATG